MPRWNGVFDDRTSEQAYQQGYDEQKSGETTDMDQLASHASNNLIMDIVTGGDSRSDNEKAYDAGHDDAKKEDSWW